MPECKYDFYNCNKDDVHFCGEGTFACIHYDSSKPKGEECTKAETEWWNEKQRRKIGRA